MICNYQQAGYEKEKRNNAANDFSFFLQQSGETSPDSGCKFNFTLCPPSHLSVEHNGRVSSSDVSPSPEGCLLALVWQRPYPGINALSPGLEKEIPVVGSCLLCPFIHCYKREYCKSHKRCTELLCQRTAWFMYSTQKQRQN